MEDIQQLTLGQKLKQARTDAHLKQHQVAKMLHVSVSSVCAMENDQRKVEAAELFQLSKLYAKPMEWFFEDQQPIQNRRGIRWYDNDPLIRECIFLMEKATPIMRKRVAYGILGFLSDR